MTEPCCDFRRKKRRESAAHALIVGVEPFEFVCSQQVLDHRSRVYIAAGQGLELKEIPEHAGFSFFAEDDILVPYSMHALAVEARFV